jgi:precorrin-4 methylase
VVEGVEVGVVVGVDHVRQLVHECLQDQPSRLHTQHRQTQTNTDLVELAVEGMEVCVVVGVDHVRQLVQEGLQDHRSLAEPKQFTHATETYTDKHRQIQTDTDLVELAVEGMEVGVVVGVDHVRQLVQEGLQDHLSLAEPKQVVC